MENTAIATTPATVNPFAMTIPGVDSASMLALKSPKGKVVGFRAALGGTGKSFKELRIAMRDADPTLKGDKLRDAVEAAFFGDANAEIAKVAGRYALDYEISKGKLPNVWTHRNGTSTLSFVARGKKADAKAQALKAKELLAKQMGITLEQLEATLATAPKPEAAGNTVEIEAQTSAS